MKENITEINNTEKVSLESKILAINGSGKFSGENLLRQYKLLEPKAKQIAKEEIDRYFKALDTVEYFNEDQKNKEMADGAYEIMQDAQLGRRARSDVSEFELNKNLTPEELAKIEQQEKTEKADEEQEQELLRKIEEGYKKLVESRKQK